MFNALRHTRQRKSQLRLNKTGSYVRVVNLEARVFDPLSRLKQLIDAQGR
jgi:hypothetical protein